MKTPWYEEWFNEDYLALYAHRSDEAAAQEVRSLIRFLRIPPHLVVLDLACGNGRHLLTLAKLGFSGVGVDLSPTMIAKAKERLEGYPVTIHRADMRTLPDLGSFDLITSFFTSFGYFDSPEDDRKVLQQVYHRLKPGGYFLLDFLNPSYVRTHLESKSELHVGDQKAIVTRQIHGRKLTKEIQLGQKQYVERLHLYTQEELTKLLETEGFNLQNVLGNYAGAPPSNEEPRLIFWAQKK